jgi:hypothetical protein
MPRLINALACTALFALFVTARAQDSKPNPADLQDAADTKRLPAPKTVEKKVKDLGEKVATLESLRKRLESLGSPTQRQPGEAEEAYALRVDRILKARALYVHLLHQQTQDALEAKFAAEAYLEDYRVWADGLAKALQITAETYRKRAAKMEADTAELEQDLIVLAHLIHEEDPKLAKQMDQLYDKELLAAVKDRAGREEKFKKLKPEERVAKLDETVAAIKDNQFELRLLNGTAIRETAALANYLPDAHAKALKQLEDALSNNRRELLNLEDRAAQVSILAKYALDNLAFVRPDNAKGGRPPLPGELAAAEEKIRKGLNIYLNLCSEKPGVSQLEPEAAADLKTQLKRRFRDSMPPTGPKESR